MRGPGSLVVLMLKIQLHSDLVYPGPSVKGSYGRVEVFFISHLKKNLEVYILHVIILNMFF